MKDSGAKDRPEGAKRRKRVITKARREQNRLAVRAYRQRHSKMSSRDLHNSDRGRRLCELKPRQPSEIDTLGTREAYLVIEENGTGSENIHAPEIETLPTALVQHSERLIDIQQPDSSQYEDTDRDDIVAILVSVASFICSVDLNPTSGHHAHDLMFSPTTEDIPGNLSFSYLIQNPFPAVPHLPNTYKNYIQPSRSSVYIACLYNARCLGIKPHELTTSQCLSRFYRSTITADDPHALLASALASIPSLPLHLQPTLPQILFPHSTYLDLLPFPVFRAQAILLASCTPKLYDPIDLKMDILQGGIVCWRSSGNGNGKGNGQPWDLRSWEAAPWFLKKWRMLVDGEDGEIWKQSVWWQKERERNGIDFRG